MNTLEQSAVNSNATREITFGNGRFSALMSESFKDCKRIFRMDDTHAERIAKQIGSDYGAAESSGIITGKLGKANKDMKVTVASSCKVKNVQLTFALTVLYAIQYANEASKYGFVSGTTEWKPNDNLTAALDHFAD